MLQKEKVIEYFEEQAKDYNQAYAQEYPANLRNFILNERKALVLNMLRKKQGRVLDVGCGPAVFAEPLLEQGLEVWGIDPSAKMIAAGKESLKSYSRQNKLHLCVGEVENLNFVSNFFDIVLCIGVLEYLDNGEKALKEINRIIKKGGWIILSFPNSISPFNLIDFIIARLFQYFTWLVRIVLKFFGKEIKLDAKRMLLTGSIVSKKYSFRSIHKLLEIMGYNKFTVVYHGYRFAFMRSFFEKAVILLNQKLKLNQGCLAWLGIDCIVRAEKV